MTLTLTFEPLFELWTSVAAARPPPAVLVDLARSCADGRYLEAALEPDPPPRHPGPAGARRVRDRPCPGALTKVVVSDIDVFLVIDTTTSARTPRTAGPSARAHRLDAIKADALRSPTTYGGARYSVITFDNGSLVRMPLVADPTALQTHPRHPRGRARRLRRRLQHQRGAAHPAEASAGVAGSSIRSACGWCSTSATGSRPATTRPSRWPRRRRSSPTARCSATAPRRAAPMRPNLDFGSGRRPTAAVPARHHPAGLAHRDLAHRRGRAEEDRVAARRRLPAPHPGHRADVPRRRRPDGPGDRGARGRRRGAAVLGARCCRRSCCCSGIWCSPARNVGDLRAARPPRGSVRAPDGLVRATASSGEKTPATSRQTLPARRRRMLLFSMILVIPLGVLAVGTGINVGLAAAVQQSFAAGDYQGAAAWARAGRLAEPVRRVPAALQPRHRLRGRRPAARGGPRTADRSGCRAEPRGGLLPARQPRAHLRAPRQPLLRRRRPGSDAIDAYRAREGALGGAARRRLPPGPVVRPDRRPEQRRRRSRAKTRREQQQQQPQRARTRRRRPIRRRRRRRTPRLAHARPVGVTDPGSVVDARPRTRRRRRRRARRPTPNPSGRAVVLADPGPSGQPSPSPHPARPASRSPAIRPPARPAKRSATSSTSSSPRARRPTASARTAARKHGLADKPW